MQTIGIDLGGTKINFGRVEFQEHSFFLSKKITAQTPQNQKDLLDLIFASLKKIKNSKTEGIGLALAGKIDLKKQQSISSPNLPYLENLNLAQIFQKKIKLPITVENDADAFTLAESIYGAGREKNLVFGITIGTGLGSGFCQNQKIYYGSKTSAMEIGHTVIEAGGRLCPCGQKGCLEAYVSATALIKEYQTQTGFLKDTFAIAKEAQLNEEPATAIISKMSEYLNLGLKNVINILEPDIIILGGGMSNVPELTNPVINQNKKRVVLSQLGENAGLIGGAITARS